MAVMLTRRVDFPMLDMAGIAFYPRIFDLAHRFFEEAALDWLITDARRQDLGEPSPQQKAMAELLGTDLIGSTN